MVEKGQVVENGNHTTLMEKAGTYRKLYLAQQELEEYGKRDVAKNLGKEATDELK